MCRFYWSYAKEQTDDEELAEPQHPRQLRTHVRTKAHRKAAAAASAARMKTQASRRHQATTRVPTPVPDASDPQLRTNPAEETEFQHLVATCAKQCKGMLDDDEMYCLRKLLAKPFNPELARYRWGHMAWMCMLRLHSIWKPPRSWDSRTNLGGLMVAFICVTVAGVYKQCVFAIVGRVDI